MSSAQHQNLRVLDGRFALVRGTDVEPGRDVLAVVHGPDGGATMVRDDAARDAWVALWNGDDAHDPDATGMISAIVAPLAAHAVAVWTVASYDGDLVLVPADQLDAAIAALRDAGHSVVDVA